MELILYIMTRSYRKNRSTTYRKKSFKKAKRSLRNKRVKSKSMKKRNNRVNKRRRSMKKRQRGGNVDALKGIIIESLKENDVSLIAYVPDGVTWQVLSKIEQDPYFKMVPATREEDNLGIVAGAYAANLRGAVFMQSSGFGNCLNALGSFCIPFRIPFPMLPFSVTTYHN